MKPRKRGIGEHTGRNTYSTGAPSAQPEKNCRTSGNLETSLPTGSSPKCRIGLAPRCCSLTMASTTLSARGIRVLATDFRTAPDAPLPHLVGGLGTAAHPAILRRHELGHIRCRDYDVDASTVSSVPFMMTGRWAPFIKIRAIEQGMLFEIGMNGHAGSSRRAALFLGSRVAVVRVLPTDAHRLGSRCSQFAPLGVLGGTQRRLLPTCNRGLAAWFGMLATD